MSRSGDETTGLRRYACFKCRVHFKNVKICPHCRAEMMAMNYRWKPPLKAQIKKWEQSRRFMTWHQKVNLKPNSCPLDYQFIPKKYRGRKHD